jgi:hypothetical protein
VAGGLEGEISDCLWLEPSLDQAEQFGKGCYKVFKQMYLKSLLSLLNDNMKHIFNFQYLTVLKFYNAVVAHFLYYKHMVIDYLPPPPTNLSKPFCY